MIFKKREGFLVTEGSDMRSYVRRQIDIVVRMGGSLNCKSMNSRLPKIKDS